MLATTREMAWAVSTDAANRKKKKAGRKYWNVEDYNEAVRTFDRLWPKKLDIKRR